jgi:RNA polymerase sigma-70 factor, ECF subfamily
MRSGSEIVTDAVERFTAVFRQHYPRVLAYALRRADEAGASDVVAETFLAAWRHIERIPEDPLPWLYRTAGWCLANQARGQRRQLRLADRIATCPLPGFIEVDPADAVAEAASLGAALDMLDDSDREVPLLVAWEDLDHRAAAYVLGCSPVTFRVRLHRARKRLARLLEQPAPRTVLLPAKEI